MSNRTPRSQGRTRALPALLLAGALLAGGCAGNASSGTAGATGAAASRSLPGGWLSLDDLSLWRGYKKDHVPSAWTKDGDAITLNRAPGAETGDLMTRQEFGDFELELDWKAAPGSNSGVIYRVSEDQPSSYNTGPEMQVLDDERHPDGKIPSHRAGALYDLIVPPQGIAHPAGEWNHARLRVQGNHIQQWLNETKTADVEIGSPAWNEMYQKSKFRTMPRFAANPRGYLVLQDHGDRVWFRNIRVRPLDGGR